MPEHFTYDVFLSHSAKDETVVRALAERLRADGLRVWCDDGDTKEELKQSRALVLCMSANAFGEDWARLESGHAAVSRPAEHGATIHAVGAPCHAQEAGGVPPEDAQAAPGFPVPEPHGTVIGAGGSAAAVGAPGHAQDTGGVTFEHAQAASCLHVPDPHGLVLGAGEHEYSVRTEGDAANGSRVAEREDPHFRSLGGRLCRRWAARFEEFRIFRVAVRRTPVDVEELLQRALERRIVEPQRNRRALSGADENVVRLWDVETGRCLRVLEGHSASVWSVAWSPDGRRAVSGSDDHAVRIWEDASSISSSSPATPTCASARATARRSSRSKTSGTPATGWRRRFPCCW